jgi:hypothetical protein
MIKSGCGVAHTVAHMTQLRQVLGLILTQTQFGIFGKSLISPLSANGLKDEITHIVIL